MKIIYFLFLACLFSCDKKTDSTLMLSKLQNGDLIFQTSTSAQSKAIQLATKSKYSHCGIIYREGSDYYVFEAIQLVTKTPLQQWIDRGESSHYVVKRLKDSKALTPANLAKMQKSGKKMEGKNYYLYFEWSDDRIYCSELIWKIYKEGTGVELGKLQDLQEFDLSHPAVKQKMKERYGSKIPLKEKVISPAAIYNSDLLYTVVAE